MGPTAAWFLKKLNASYLPTPRRRFGQNFLNSPFVLSQMKEAISPKKNDCLIEIGPGQGALTEVLLPHVDHMDAVELDRDLIVFLKQKFLVPLGKLTLHASDVLKFDFHAWAKNYKNNNKIRIVGNLPYNISTELLFYLLTYLADIQDLHFLLQKEVVDRISAEVGTREYGRLSVLLQYYFHIEPLFLVPPESFYPAPKVMSQFVRLIPKENKNFSFIDIDIDIDIGFRELDEILKLAFQMRRKTLRNNFKNMTSFLGQPVTYEMLEDIFDRLKLSMDARPQNLSVKDFSAIAAELKKKII